MLVPSKTLRWYLSSCQLSKSRRSEVIVILQGIGEYLDAFVKLQCKKTPQKTAQLMQKKKKKNCNFTEDCLWLVKTAKIL